ncbi:phage integrase SAM-like domain-containing protein [Fluviicola sp.]|uniref:site-specific integrase n=1 Tax=Fluviicola sp. TaxID=1917219 RepID=UPI0031E20B89
MKVTIRQKSGMLYLYADITVSKLRVKGTLGITIKEGRFNPKTQTVQGTSDAPETNILINNFKSEILAKVRTLQKDGALTKDNLTDAVKEIRTRLTDPEFSNENEQRLTTYVRKYIDRVKELRKESTIKQFYCSLNKIEEYERLKKVKLTFDKIDHAFYNSLMTYGMKELNLSTNSLGNIVKNLKTWMNAAYEDSLHTNMIFTSRSFKKPAEEADTIYLNESELRTIRNTIMPNKHLDNVRDLFLLACYTGVRSQDYSKLSKEYLINDGTMFKVRAEKTDQEVIIPLHPEAKRVLDKYDGQPRVMSNQKFNEYIKEVCRIAGLDEPITTTRTIGGKKVRTTKAKCEWVSSHCARRSFATNAYKAGVPTLAIMAITGHTTEKVFLKYVRVTKEEHAGMMSGHQFFKQSVA